MKKIDKIKSCDDCPLCDYNPEYYRCSHQDCDGVEMKDIDIIQTWCPLPEDD